MTTIYNIEFEGLPPSKNEFISETSKKWFDYALKTIDAQPLYHFPVIFPYSKGVDLCIHFKYLQKIIPYEDQRIIAIRTLLQGANIIEAETFQIQNIFVEYSYNENPKTIIFLKGNLYE